MLDAKAEFKLFLLSTLMLSVVGVNDVEGRQLTREQGETKISRVDLRARDSYRQNDNHIFGRFL